MLLSPHAQNRRSQFLPYIITTDVNSSMFKLLVYNKIDSIKVYCNAVKTNGISAKIPDLNNHSTTHRKVIMTEAKKIQLESA